MNSEFDYEKSALLIYGPAKIARSEVAATDLRAALL